MPKQSSIRSELADALFRMRRSFYSLAAFSGVINVMMLTPAIYMLQVYDRALVSRNVTTLAMLTVLVVGLFLLMSTLEMVRTRVLIRVGNCLDMDLNRRIFTAAFERNLSRAGGNPAQALQDLAQVRQFVTGNSLFAFFDAPWTPIYLLVAYLIHPILGLITLIGSLILMGLAWLTERRRRSRWPKPIRPPSPPPNMPTTTCATPRSSRPWACCRRSASAGSKVICAFWKCRPGLRPRRLYQQHRALRADHFAVFDPRRRRAAGDRRQDHPGDDDCLLDPHRPRTGSGGTGHRIVETTARLPYGLGPAQRDAARLSAPATEHVAAAANGHAGGRECVCRSPGYQQHDSARGELQPCPRRKPWHHRPIRLGQVHPRPPAGWRLAGPSRQGAPGRRRHIQLEQGRTWPWLGYLPQDVELFEGNIADNIARFGEVDSEAVIRAAKITGVHEMILRFPQGYDTRLGTDGSPLSGGQKQRIALARALYGEPNLIVLDEPNANLDDVGEKALVDALAELKGRGATVILISHRPNVLCAVDKVLMLRDGGVQMLGTRDEVFAALRKASVIPAGASTPLASVKARE